MCLFQQIKLCPTATRSTNLQNVGFLKDQLVKATLSNEIAGRLPDLKVLCHAASSRKGKSTQCNHKILK
jgi:hypothetical protein